MSKKLENLIAGHAYWSDKKNELKYQGIYELESCEGLDQAEDQYGMTHSVGTTCIQNAFEQMKTQNENAQFPDDSFISFEEVWEDNDAEGDICQHCQNVRKLKRERVKASRRLGAIRGAMTKIGRKLEYKQKEVVKG